MKFLTVLLIIIPAVAFGQKCTAITGTVSAQSGDVLPGASIRLKSKPSTGTSTAYDGAFSLSLTVTDTLIVSFIGYEDRFVPVNIAGSCTVSIVLKSNAQTMDEIVIKAQPLIAEEFKTNSFSQLDIYLNPGSKADPILAVNSLPAATTLDESANISLRGSSPDETGIFLDNVPVHDAVRYSQLNGIGTFSIFNTQLINKVQVFPGNPPLEFGGTTSGLISLETKSSVPKKISQKVSLTLASLGWFGEFKTGKNSALTAFTNYQPSDFLKAVNEGSLARLKKFESNDIGLHWYLKTSKNGQLKIFNYSLKEKYIFGYREPTFDGDFHQKKRRNFTVASFAQPLGNAELSLNQGISFSGAKYGFGIADFRLNLKDFYSSVNFSLPGNKLDWKTGVTHETRSSDFRGTFPTYEYAVGPEYPHMSAEAVSRNITTEWYGYTKYHGVDRLTIGVGLRANLPSSGQKNYLSFQGNSRYEFNDQYSVIVSYGRYNKYEFIQGSNNNQLISSDQFSTDFIYKEGAMEGTLSFFNKKISQSGSKTDVMGGEVYFKYSRSQKFQAQVSFTTLNAKITSNGSTYSSPYDISYFLRGNFVYTFIPTWSFNTIALYRQGSPYNPIVDRQYNDQLNVYMPTFASVENQERLPYYGNISCTINKLFTIADRFPTVAFAGLSNIVNRENVRGYLYNFDYTERENDLLSERTLYFGMVITL